MAKKELINEGKKMVKSIKNKWVKALRSGVYKQTTGTLCENIGYIKREFAYCCLGVLSKEVTGHNDYTRSVLSYSMLKKCGVSWETQSTLVDLNDTSKWSFKKIANWIEKNL